MGTNQVVLEHPKTETLSQRITNFFTSADGSLPKEYSQRFLYRLKKADELADHYERRIVELADGMSIKDVINTLYSEELQHGAWVTGIGMVERQWKYEMAQTVEKLAKRGYIYCDSREIVQATEQQGLAEKIGLHLKVYQTLSNVKRLSNNKLTRSTLLDIIPPLTDVRQVLAGSNGVFDKKERQDIERKLATIYNTATQKVLYN